MLYLLLLSLILNVINDSIYNMFSGEDWIVLNDNKEKTEVRVHSIV